MAQSQRPRVKLSIVGCWPSEPLGDYLPAYGSTTFSGCITLAGTKGYALMSDNNNVDENVASPGAMPGPVDNENAGFAVTWEAH
ncbi:MAG: hypothetical protein ACRDK8_06470 [Solirubrobacteraceae bacterium]